MHYLRALFAMAAMAATALAVPAGQLEPRATTVICKPKMGSKEVKFTVDVDDAARVAKAAGYDQKGKGSYPHVFKNFNNKVKFGRYHCDKTSADRGEIYEYPIYSEEARKKLKNPKAEWVKDLKTDAQKRATPVRAVYGNVQGTFYFCGIMTHTTVTSDDRGTGDFTICA